jgi:hypothetical protein
LWPKPPQPVAEATAEVSALPPDLRLVPPDAFGVASVRVGDLWGFLEPARPVAGLKELLDVDGLVKELQRELSIHPRDLERLTAVMLSDTIPGTALAPGRVDLPLLILSTSRPFEFRKLRLLLEPLAGGLARRQHGGWTIYAAREEGLALCPVSDRVVVAGAVREVRRLLDRQPVGAAQGPLSEALAQAAGGRLLVAALRPSPRVAAQIRVDPKVALRPLAEVESALLTLDLLPDSRKPLFGLDLDLSLRFPDEARAARGLEAARALPRQVLDQGLPRATPPYLAALLAAPLRALRQADWLRAGRLVRCPVRFRWSAQDRAWFEAELGRLAARRQRLKNLEQVGAALHLYHSEHGRFPPAVVTSPTGKPLWSWRVELLPYLGDKARFERLHSGRPWDHPANRGLLAQAPAAFRPPWKAPPSQTHYRAIVGPGAAFEGKEGLLIADFKDGTANTLLVVEAAEPVHWAAPVDLAYAPGQPPLAGLGLPWRGQGRPQDEHLAAGFCGLMADGSTWFFPRSIDPRLLDALCTRAGGERVDLRGLRLLPQKKERR